MPWLCARESLKCETSKVVCHFILCALAKQVHQMHTPHDPSSFAQTAAFQLTCSPRAPWTTAQLVETQRAPRCNVSATASWACWLWRLLSWVWYCGVHNSLTLMQSLPRKGYKAVCRGVARGERLGFPQVRSTLLCAMPSLALVKRERNQVGRRHLLQIRHQRCSKWTLPRQALFAVLCLTSIWQ